MIIGFTGTQIGMSEIQKERLRIALVDAPEFHHGDCIGADSEAHDIALEAGCPIVIHPPRVDAKRAFCKGAATVLEPKDYLARNHDIVDACTLLIAGPKSPEEELRSGTWATVRYARKVGRTILIL